MKKIKKKFGETIQRVIDVVMGNGLMQAELSADGSDMSTAELSALARRCAAEGCVLLKNDGVLPLDKNKKVAVFGRCQLDWFYVGYGSGGDVHPPYRVDLIGGLCAAGVSCDANLLEKYKTWCSSEDNKADHGWWGHWPMSHPEMPLDESEVREAAEKCPVAIVVIGRAAGEERENTLTSGSYYLTDEEKRMLRMVSEAFLHTVVVMNIGNIIDMAWTEEYSDKLSAVLIAWQGGMESGNAVADVLTGKVNPCGKLSDTIAKNYEDYPSSSNFGGEDHNFYAEDIFVGYRYFETFADDKVMYPFGYGLSYTEFETIPLGFESDGEKYTATVKVKNVGECSGKEVVMLWCRAPVGTLAKASRILAAYKKTPLLLPDESCEIELTFDKKSISSFDDSGASGYKHSFVLEAGEYRFFAGEKLVGCFELSETECIEKCEAVCAVNAQFERMTVKYTDGGVELVFEKTPVEEVCLRERILDRLPPEISVTGDKGYKLSHVTEGKLSLDDFIAQLSDNELEALTRGEGGMNSSLGVEGNAGAFGGVIPSLREKGVPPVITADGPAGLRLKRFCSLLPIGTCLACTWDEGLVEELFSHVGKELIRHKVDIILSPGMNIHRNVLCGRNFEYFSEDPLLTGKTAAAVIRGVQSCGVSCCPKHFACNNQEKRRNVNDSRVSEKALREIYLRGFEIAVKEGRPDCIMTSYNKINGVWAHYNYDLVTTVLRGEWGFGGVVVTDWWMKKSKSPEFPLLRDNAYRVRSQVDVLMPGDMSHISKKYHSDGTLLETLGKPEGIQRGELQRTAKNVLGYILKNKMKK